MGFFDIFKTKSSDSFTGKHRYGLTALETMFGGSSTVTEEEAMSIPTVYDCVSIIGGSVAQLPIYLYKEDDEGHISKVKNDPRVYLLNNQPNDTISAYDYKKKLCKDYFFYGASYSYVERDLSDITGIYPFDMNDVQVRLYKQNGYKDLAKINLEGKSHTDQDFFIEDLIMVLNDSSNGITGKGILKHHEEILKLALDEINYSRSIVGNGAIPIGVIETDDRLTDEAFESLRSSWDNMYSGSKKAGKTAILEEGAKYRPISIKPNELEMTNSKKATVTEICKLFAMPESMLNAAANKYASNSQNNVHFMQYCISPLINSIESSLDKALLLESEKREGYFFRFDTSELLRTTESEKIEAVVNAVKGKVMKVGEARSKLDLPPLKADCDYFMFTLGDVLYDDTCDEMKIANLGATMSSSGLLKNKVGDQENEQKDGVTVK